MMFKFISNTLLFSLLMVSISFAQIEIKGKIYDQKNQNVVGATVVLENTKWATYSDAEGNFIFTNVNTGTYNLMISGVNIENLTQKIEVQKDLYLELKVNEKIQNLSVVEVKSNKEMATLRTLSEVEGTQIFAGKKAEVISMSGLDANLVTNNARQIFARTPGVSVWENDGSGIQVGVAVRGLSPNRSWEFNVRQNGYDVSADVFGYPEAYYNPPMEAVKEIQMVRGSASLQFGPQFGGLLNYVLKGANPNNPLSVEIQSTLGSFGLHSNFVSLGGTKGKWSYYGYVHNRSAEGWRQNSRYNIQHYHAQINYQINSTSKIGLEYTQMDFKSQQAGGLTDVQFGQDARQSFRARNWFSTPWHLLALNFDTQLSENIKLNAKVFGLLSERNSIGFMPSNGITVLDIPTNNIYANRRIDRDFYQNIGAEIRTLTNYHLFNQEHNLAIGVRTSFNNTFRKQNGRGDAGFDYNTALQNDAFGNQNFDRELTFTTKNVAIFIENKFRINSKWTATVGGRYDYVESIANGRLNFNSNGTEENLITPQFVDRNIFLFGLGTEYKVLPSMTLYSNISQSFRPVYYAELTPPATTDVIDQNLRDANGFNFELGTRGNIKQFFRFDVNYFRLHYNDRIGNLTMENENGIRYQLRTNVGNSVNEGFEGYIEFTPTRLTENKSKIGEIQLFANLAFIDAKYTNLRLRTFANNQFVENNLKGNQVENAPQYIHRFGLSYLLKGFSFTYQISSVGSAFSDANNTETATSNGVTGVIPSYQVMDFSASYNFLTYYQFKFSINNLTNQMYFTRRAGGYPGPGLLPADGRSFYITFGVKF